MAPKSNAYWEKRANARMEYYHRNFDKTINTVTRAYDKAIEDINKEIQDIFERYSDNGILSPTEARTILNTPISRAEINELKNTISTIEDERIRKQLLSRVNAPAYAARITRLQALKEKIYIESKKIADVEIQASTEGYIETINNAYHRAMFDIQKGVRVGFDVSSMPSSTIEAILKNPWSGSHFSKRVWGNTDVLADKLTKIVSSGMMSGRSLDKMVKELEGMSTVGKHAAARIIRTETTYMANAAEMESYKEADIDKYIFIATLDLRTSNLCKEHDGQVYEIDKAVPGENMPPLHPNCRSTTIAYFGEENLKGIERRAVDPETGKDYKIPADMKYEEWYKEKVVDKYGQDKADIMKKKIINKASDRKQHKRYRDVLGDEIPENVDEFQELKYNRIEKWEDIKHKFEPAFVQKDFRDIPSFHKNTSDLLTRKWYNAHDKNISNLIDKSKPIEEQARQAHGLRNTYRTQARDLMKDQEKRKQLDIDFPNKSFDEFITDKMNRKTLTRDQAMADTIKTATVTNKKVNKSLGLE